MYLRVRREKLTTLFIKRGKITDPGGKVLLWLVKRELLRCVVKVVGLYDVLQFYIFPRGGRYAKVHVPK